MKIKILKIQANNNGFIATFFLYWNLCQNHYFKFLFQIKYKESDLRLHVIRSRYAEEHSLNKNETMKYLHVEQTKLAYETVNKSMQLCYIDLYHYILPSSFPSVNSHELITVFSNNS